MKVVIRGESERKSNTFNFRTDSISDVSSVIFHDFYLRAPPPSPNKQAVLKRKTRGRDTPCASAQGDAQFFVSPPIRPSCPRARVLVPPSNNDRRQRRRRPRDNQ